MKSIETAILRTVLYADVFDYPMTTEEIHHFLIAPEPVSLDNIRYTLTASADLDRLLIQQDGYIACTGRAAIITQRQQRQQYTQSLWPQAVMYGRWLGRMPFVRMVAMTGALAMHNPADPDDDLDYFLVTASDRVWLARAFSILLVRWARWRGMIICPNFVLAENHLTQQQQDLYVAHEIVQMVPLYGLATYRRFLAENTWTGQHLANARTTYYHEHEQQTGPFWSLVKAGMETLLTGPIGNVLERWEHQRKSRRFAPDTNINGSAAQIDSTQVKGHFQDHGQRIMDQYHQRLAAFNLPLEP